MKQAVMIEPGRIEIRDAPRPSPGTGELLLGIRLIGVCGSDVHVWGGKHPFTTYPVVQGHEFSAVVEEVGEGVSDFEPGMKATQMPQLVCRRCRPCLRGDYHICEHLRVQGFQAPGCAQEFFVAEAARTLRLPDRFTFEQGAFIEPLAVAVHAVAKAGELSGRNVVVLGAGPIGNLAGQVARAEGAAVLITDISDHRLEIARQCGLEATSNAAEEPLKEAADREFAEGGFDVALECVGVEATIGEAVEGIQKGGTIVVAGVFGVFGKKPRVDLGLLQDRELTLRGTLMYRRRDYERSIELIAGGKIATGPLCSKHFPIDEYAGAYEFIATQGDKAMKVFIDV